MAYKLEKTNVQIQKYISDIIQFDLKNKEVGFCTVTGVDCTNDYSYAKVYVSFLIDNKATQGLEALEKSKGFIRSELAKKLTIRKCPQLVFIYDDSFQKAQHIEELIKSTKK